MEQRKTPLNDHLASATLEGGSVRTSEGNVFAEQYSFLIRSHGYRHSVIDGLEQVHFLRGSILPNVVR